MARSYEFFQATCNIEKDIVMEGSIYVCKPFSGSFCKSIYNGRLYNMNVQMDQYCEEPEKTQYFGPSGDAGFFSVGTKSVHTPQNLPTCMVTNILCNLLDKLMNILDLWQPLHYHGLGLISL